MRTPLVFLAAAVALAACAPRGYPSGGVPYPRNASSVRIISDIPRCPFRELGSVSGRMISDVQRAAFSMRAHAVLMERVEGGASTGIPHAGMAIVFTDPECRG